MAEQPRTFSVKVTFVPAMVVLTLNKLLGFLSQFLFLLLPVILVTAHQLMSLVNQLLAE